MIIYQFPSWLRFEKSATWFFLTKENPLLLTLDIVLVFISPVRQDFFHILTSEIKSIPYLLKISPFISLSVCFCSSWKDATPFDTRSGDLMTCYRLTNPKISCKGFGAVGKRMLLSLDHQDSSTYHRIVLTNCSLNFCTPEGAVTGKDAAITLWRLKPLTNQIVSTISAAITIWRFIANDQSNRLPKFR